MGKYLVINGADFSTNGIPVVDVLAELKSAMEAAYYEHMRFETPAPTGAPATAATNRSAWGMIDATGFPSFIITAKSGFQFVPIQADSSNHGKHNFTWITGSVTFEGFDAYKYVGCNLAYANNVNLPDGMSLWDFIEVALAE